MAATLQNIPTPSETWIDIYPLTTITSGKPIEVQNIGTTDLYYSIADTQPPNDSDSYKIFSRGESRVFENGDLKVWVFSPQSNGLINAKAHFSSAKDYFVELALGNIEGSSGAGKVHRSTDLTNAGFLPGWGGNTHLIFPTAAETWELVSDSVNDTLAGTGAQVILVNYLDDNYVEQTATVNMSGTVGAIVAFDCFRPSNMVVISSGSTKFNEGKITLQVSGGGNPRGFIKPTFANSQDTYMTVPAGKTLLLTKASPYWGKNDSGRFKGVIHFFGSNTDITNGNFPAYQNTYDIGFEVPFIAPEKTDFWFEFKSENDTPTEVNFVTEFILRDN